MEILWDCPERRLSFVKPAVPVCERVAWRLAVSCTAGSVRWCGRDTAGLPVGVQASGVRGAVVSALRAEIVPLCTSESDGLGYHNGLFGIVSAFILVLIFFFCIVSVFYYDSARTF